MEPKYVGTEKDLQSLLLKKDSAEGDIVVCEDTKKSFIFKDNEWVPYTPTGGLQMSLYDINQSIISQLPAFTDKQILELGSNIFNFGQMFSNSEYFMFLCNDIHYYTLFHKDEDNCEFSNLGQAVLTIIRELEKDIVAADNFKDRYEIWLRSNDSTNVFILFPYDEGVVTYG